MTRRGQDSNAQDDIKRVNMNASMELKRRIDEWRRCQPDIPNFSESIRRLVDIGLRAEMRGREEQP